MTVKTLVEALRLEELSPGTYRADNFEMGERGVVFGGQLIAQLLVAGSTVDASKRVKSAHALFARPVLVDDEVELRVDVLQAGKTFASATTSLWQAGKERARAMVLLTAGERDLIRYGSPMPTVGAPEDAAPFHGNEDVRVVGDADIFSVAATGDPAVDVWFRVPDSATTEAEAQGLLAHSSASFLIGASMRPHEGVGQSAAHAAFSTGIIGHTVSFHEPIEAGAWHLLAHRHTFAGRGRVFGHGEVFTRDGRLVASFSQEAMVRHFPEGVSPEGQESTIL
jgi:acyl-CoA thioesterase